MDICNNNPYFVKNVSIELDDLWEITCMKYLWGGFKCCWKNSSLIPRPISTFFRFSLRNKRLFSAECLTHFRVAVLWILVSIRKVGRHIRWHRRGVSNVHICHTYLCVRCEHDNMYSQFSCDTHWTRNNISGYTGDSFAHNNYNFILFFQAALENVWYNIMLCIRSDNCSSNWSMLLHVTTRLFVVIKFEFLCLCKGKLLLSTLKPAEGILHFSSIFW